MNNYDNERLETNSRDMENCGFYLSELSRMRNLIDAKLKILKNKSKKMYSNTRVNIY